MCGRVDWTYGSDNKGRGLILEGLFIMNLYQLVKKSTKFIM